MSELHLKLLERIAPPSILIDREYDILHLSAGASRLLQVSAGEPTRNLLRMVHPDLRIELRAALLQASQSHQAVDVPPVALEIGGEALSVSIRVEPAHDIGSDLFLVMLELQGPRPASEPGEAVVERAGNDPVARHLDRELERLKTHLRETVEQFEGSTEELKASNEELQAMNEELRSATEELETSREELQSINEEVTTVNHELKSKVDELSTANSDMHNLMNATAIATVFLDRELRITRFTPTAVNLFHLIPSDLGRPLTDLTTQLAYPDLTRDAQRVLERLVPIETRGRPVRWQLVPGTPAALSDRGRSHRGGGALLHRHHRAQAGGGDAALAGGGDERHCRCHHQFFAGLHDPQLEQRRRAHFWL